MLEFHNNILCAHAGWLFGDAQIMSEHMYRYLSNQKAFNVVRRGCKGNPALVDYESLPDRFKKEIEKAVGGDPYKKVKHKSFNDQLKPDPAAAEFYANFKLSDGRNLPENNQRQYQAEAEILNALSRIVGSQQSRRRALGGSNAGTWKKVTEVLQRIDKNRYPHNLPTNERRLKQKYNAFIKQGYQSLISKKFGNDNSRKVNVKIERLLLSLYCLPNKPYANEVFEKYMQFLGGSIDVVDVKTGEVFEREEFYEDGQPITISEATVWNYLNDPKNRALVDKHRAGDLEYKSLYTPHHHRHQPKYSLSKISLDDRDLQRKMPDGKRVKGYYASDVTSGAIIGYAHSKHKTADLFVNCVRNMFRFIKNQGLKMPMEVEVEHHLVNLFKDDFMRVGALFPFVRWANPGNPQEKYAETVNRIKKHQYEKKTQKDIGRWYAKLEANRTYQDKVFDADNDNYKESTYSYEQLVADDLAIINEYNNDLHPNQKLYKGMTRLDVLLYNVNPKCAEVPEYLLYKYIGNKTTTKIRRNQYLQVQYQKYTLPSPELLNRLQPNNYEVDAYWLADDDNTISKVYMYQGDEFICECEKIVTYNTSKAESTDADTEAYNTQKEYVTEFNDMVKKKNNDFAKVTVIKNQEYNDDIKVEVAPPVPQDDDDDFDYIPNTNLSPRDSL